MDPDMVLPKPTTNSREIGNANFVTIDDLKKLKNELKEQLEKTEIRIRNQIKEQPATIKSILIRVLDELKLTKCNDITKSTSNTKLIPLVPFSSSEKFLKYDSEIQNDEEKYSQLVCEFESQNAKDLSHYVRLNLKKFVTDEAAQHMCWKGTDKKKPVRTLAITQALKAACVKKYNIEADLNFERICILHFQHAKGRHEKKLNYRSKVKLVT